MSQNSSVGSEITGNDNRKGTVSGTGLENSGDFNAKGLLGTEVNVSANQSAGNLANQNAVKIEPTEENRPVKFENNKRSASPSGKCLYFLKIFQNFFNFFLNFFNFFLI